MIMRKIDVLPEPFGPMRPIFSPRWMEAEAARKRAWWPGCRTIESRDITVAGIARDGRDISRGSSELDPEAEVSVDERAVPGVVRAEVAANIQLEVEVPLVLEVGLEARHRV